MSSRVVLKSSIPQFTRRVEVGAPIVVTKTGVDIEAGAKRNIIANGSVDTSNLLNSVAWTPESDLKGEVRVGAEYGAPVEFGSHHPERAYESAEGGLDVMEAYTIPAQPFLTPAAEAAREPFVQAMRSLYE